MLFWLIFLPAILMSSCKSKNYKIFLDNDECYNPDYPIEGGTWKIQNTSYDKRIEFTYKETLTQDNGEIIINTETITLNPGAIGYLGCAKINGKFRWEAADKWQTSKYEIVGELVKNSEN